jgi:hypothetical protein
VLPPRLDGDGHNFEAWIWVRRASAAPSPPPSASVRVTASIHLRPHRGGQARDGGHHHGGPRWRSGRGQVCDSGAAAPSILHVEAQPVATQVIPRRWPPLVATQRWRAWIWARRWPPSSTATTTAGVSVGPRSGPDGPRSELDCFFFIFKFPFFVSVGNDRYYKPFIFCIVQIVSVAGADTKYRFPTDTINTFCCSVNYFYQNLREPN